MMTKPYKIFRKVIICLFVLAIGFLIYQVSESYGLFETNSESGFASDIANWQILVNDVDVGTSQTHEFSINSINWQSSTHVKSGKVAPGMQGNFDIIINPSGTEVSIRYDITFDFSSLTNEEFSVSSIQELTSNSLTRTGESTYTGIILLANINNTIHTIRTSLVWNNNEANNANDSALGSVPNNTIAIPVTVKISQYLGETIETYVEQ